MHTHQKARTCKLLLLVLALTARLLPLGAYSFPYRLQYLTTDDGLAQNTVDDMLRDSDGYMWFATWNGLDRYDGYDFHHYRAQPGGMPGLPDNGIHALTEDHYRNVWIGTVKGIAVFSLDRQRFVDLGDTDAPLRQSDITDLQATADGEVWIATKQAGLYRVGLTLDTDNRARLNVRQHIATPGPVTALTPLTADTMLVGTPQGIFTASSLADELQRLGGPVGELPATTLYADETTLWIGTGNGLFRQPRGTATLHYYQHQPGRENSLLHNTVRAICTDAEGTLLIGTLGGVNFYRPLTDDFRSLAQGSGAPHQLNNRFVNSLLADSLGNVWIGTDKGGINKYSLHQHRFGAYTHRTGTMEGLSHPTVNSVLEEGNILWVGTAGGGLNQVDRRTGHVRHFTHHPDRPRSISSDFVTSILRGPGGGLWMGTWGNGLNRMDTRNGSFTHVIDAVAADGSRPIRFISSLQNDPRGFLLIGSEEGLSLLDPETATLHAFTAPHPLANIREVGCILMDSRNNYWIGTRDGLYRFSAGALDRNGAWQPSARVERFTPDTDAGLPGNYILSLREDHRERIWIGTYGRGIAVAPVAGRDRPAFTAYGEPHGLGNNVVYSIEIDGRGRLWLGTDHGLASFDPQTKRFRNYYRADGLLSNQFYWSSSHRGEDGYLYFGSVAGLNYFRPSALGEYPRPAPAVITSLEILNDEVAVGEELHGTVPLSTSITRTDRVTLSYRDNVFSVGFSTLDYFLPDQTRFAYRMVGVDKDWMTVGADRRFASYTNLRGGEYTFEVKASNGHGTWQQQPTRLRVVILPPFYQTTWFRILIILLLAGAVATYTRWRFHFLRAQTRKLESLVTVRTAEIERQKQDLHATNQTLAQRQHEIAKQKDELERKNREISQQRDRLIELNQRVREVNQMRMKFFTNISHEFRTPLTLILDPLESLLERFSDHQEVRHSLRIVNRNAQRLLTLINQLMNFRRIEEGQQTVRMARGDVADFIRQTFHSFQELARHRGIDYRFVLSNPQSETWFDAEKLEHILYNLLANALKFTPEGGKVSLELRFVHFSGAPAQSTMEITVRDTGIGIPPGEQRLIFDHFYQAENQAERAVSGSGIGLSLVRELVNLLHGSIRLESEPGRGSAFTVVLPYRRESFLAEEITDEAARPPRLPVPVASLPPAPHPATEAAVTAPDDAPLVLVVEDNYDLRFLLSQRLGRKYRIVTAEDGEEGLSLAERHAPDLVISDVMMPKMDGMELCRQLKTNIATSHIPIILLTAKAMVENWVEGFATGADDYVAKPFNLRVLSARIDNLIRSRQRLRGLFGHQAAPGPEAVTENPVDQAFLSEVYSVLEHNYANADFSQDQLASELCISRSLLYKKIKSLTDRTVTDFVNYYKVEKASQLLATNALTISEVAYRTGFSDPKYFSRVFKKAYGYPPSEFSTRNARADLGNPN